MKYLVCCDVTLLMSEKRGIEIDYCPECCGIRIDCRDSRDYEYEQETEKFKKFIHISKKRESFLSKIIEMFGD